jgi:hypothetical protein
MQIQHRLFHVGTFAPAPGVAAVFHVGTFAPAPGVAAVRDGGVLAVERPEVGIRQEEAVAQDGNSRVFSNP